MNLPNLLTSLRILLIPLFITLLIYRHYRGAFVVFSLAGITDALDGWVARRRNQESRLGTFLDPVADKLLAVSSFITLAFTGPVPVWFAAIVISRDVIIILGCLIIFLSEGALEISPSRLGKGTTFFQFFTILLAVISQFLGDMDFLWRTTLLVTAFLTVLSGLQYLHRGLTYRSGSTPGGRKPVSPDGGSGA